MRGRSVIARRPSILGPSGRALFVGSALLGVSFALGACGQAKPVVPPPHPTTSSVTGSGGGPSGTGGAGGTGGEGGAGGVGGAPPPGCGDGKVVFPEQCDGADLGGATCKSVGFEGGAISCGKSCQLDESKCTDKELCTDGVDNDKDTKTDCADSDCALACAASCTADALTVIAPDFLVVAGDTTGHANLLHASCSAMNGAASGPEIVYQATINVTGVLDLSLLSDADLGVSVRSACAQQPTELGCADDQSGSQATERLKLPVKANDTVFLVVQGHTAADAGSYSLTVKSRAVTCGDGFTDAPEQCDDGATMSGDGCSAQCTIESSETEPNGMTAQANTYIPPWFGAISPAGDVDTIKINIPTKSTLTATIGDFDGGCQSGALDSYLVVLDQNGTTMLATDDDGGVGSCSSTQVPNLAPGAYYVRVSASPKALDPTFAYKLALALTIDICGDGVVTGGEQCDDGNLVAGDGCGTTCQLEITEKEPNNASANANPYKAKWRAQIAPVGDVDVVSIKVPVAGSTLLAEVVDDGTGDCASFKIVSHVDILNADGVSVLASGNGAGGSYCAFASAAALPAGTYFVRVLASNLAQPGVSDTFGYGLDLTLQ
ncbi:MAG: DVUA0089 family protein [Byssovorax sp.]